MSPSNPSSETAKARRGDKKAGCSLPLEPLAKLILLWLEDQETTGKEVGDDRAHSE